RGAHTARIRPGLRAARYARWRARTPTPSERAGRGRDESRAPTRAERRRPDAQSSRFEELGQVGDDDVGAVLAQGVRLTGPVDPDDEAEAPRPPCRHAGECVFEDGRL